MRERIIDNPGVQPSRASARRLGFARKAWSPVERRRRVAARLALYSSLALVAIAGWAGGRLVESPSLRAREQAWSSVDYASLPEVSLLAEYVRTDTSPTTGSEVAGARFLAEQLRRAGIEPTLDLVDATHANLWAVIEGRSPDALVLHHHIDVTSADPAQWAFPPFDGRIEGPWIRGRGTFDMKSVAIAQLLAFLDAAAEAKARGTPPERSLIFLATSAEESGSATGMRRIISQHPELLARFAAMLTEGGAVEARAIDDIKYWGIEFAQRRYVPMVAHSPGRARLEELHQAIEARGRWETAPRLCAETRAFLAAYSRSRDLNELQDVLSDPDRLVADHALFERAPPIVHALLVDALLLDPIREEPGGFALPIGLLLLPDTSLENARAALLPAELLAGVTVTVDEANPESRGSSLDHPVYHALQRVISERFGEPPVGPYMLGQTLTDARFTRALGIPSYGFSPFLIYSVDTYRVDKVDERIGLPGYVVGVAAYRQAVSGILADRSPWK